MALIAIRLHIFGKVQGVFFRQSTSEKAHSLALSGYVRNRINGFVEAFFEGEEEFINEMITWCEKGPSLAIVKKIEIIEKKIIHSRSFTDFRIQKTF